MSLSQHKLVAVNVWVDGTVRCMIRVGQNIIQVTLRWMCYDKDIDKYKCGPVVTTLSDIASLNAEHTSSVLLLIYSCLYVCII